MSNDKVQSIMALVDRYETACATSTLGCQSTRAIEARAAIESAIRAIAAPGVAQEKRAPVQGWPEGIPWSLHLEAYAVYSKRWGAQPAMIDLEGRNCRGGFSTGELDMFIPGWRDKVSEIAALRAEIERLKSAAPSPTAEQPVTINGGTAE